MKKFSTVAIGILTAIVVGSTITATPARAGYISDAIELFSAARANYGAGPLEWNDSLVDSMIGQAESCRFQHSPGAFSGQYGENIFVAGGPATIRDAVNYWMGEARDYNYENPGFAHNTGHFTAMVWKSTTRFAVIAKYDCPAGSLIAGRGPQTFVVARFTAPGNVRGQYAENVGLPQYLPQTGDSAPR